MTLASRGGSQLGEKLAVAPGSGKAGTGSAAAGAAGPDRAAVQTEVLGHVGVITLDDERRRNALSAHMVSGVVAALEGMRAAGMRAVVLRAAAGMSVLVGRS